jgi:hypothetical protein
VCVRERESERERVRVSEREREREKKNQGLASFFTSARISCESVEHTFFAHDNQPLGSVEECQQGFWQRAEVRGRSVGQRPVRRYISGRFRGQRPGQRTEAGSEVKGRFGGT